MTSAASPAAPPGKPCFWHPGAPGVAACQVCRRSVCGQCRVTLTDGKQVFCPAHGMKGHRMQSKQPW